MRYSSGVTLVELLAVLAILALILGIAAPGLRDMAERSRARSTSLALFSTLQFARAAAANSGLQIVICKSPNGYSCTAGGDWGQGWMVFEDVLGTRTCHDSTGDGICDGSTGRILRWEPGVSAATLKLINNSNVATAVRFNPDGSSPGSNGRFTVCSTLTGRAYTGLVISNVGRVRLATAAEFLPCE